MTKPILIAKTGSTFAEIRAARGDFEDWFVALFKQAGAETKVVDVTREPAPDIADYAGVVVTGSPAMVSDREPWSEAMADWLRQAADKGVPILGVCYGHQLLAHAFGGVVDYHPRGREIGTHSIELQPAAEQDALFNALPRQFKVHLTHAQSVVKLPQQAVHLAFNEFEPNQAFRMGGNVWGVQFHPEFDTEVMAAYVESFRPRLEAEGQSPDQLLSTVDETPWAQSLLKRFAELVTR